uniref:OCIA domain-containing protein n=1 Tax=Syphacia muris TaxID=451379 RepID=A0A0N5AQQ2_9BILA
MNNDTTSSISSKLSDEQLRNFITQLPPDDRSVLMENLASCTREKLYSSCIPLAAVVTGSMYIVRDSLAKILKRRIGPSLYVFAAITTIAVSNYRALRGECRNRLNPILDDLIKKYNYNSNGISTPIRQPFNNAGGGPVLYKDLRERNRRLSAELPAQQQDVHFEEADLENSIKPSSLPELTKTWVDIDFAPKNTEQEIEYSPKKDYSTSVDNIPLISGTPVGKPTTSYGDEGFS